MQVILNAYQKSQKFADLAPRTQRDYVRHIRKIEEEYQDFPVAALADRAARGEFLTRRDRMAKTSRRQADYTYSVLALIISWAHDRGLVPTNPCERPGKVYRSKRIDSIWTPEDEAAFMQTAPSHIGLAFTLALWTGQRQGDLLRLPWAAYNGESIRLQQRKTAARVEIPVGKPLMTLLEQTPKTAVTILATSRNTPWTESGFRASWRKACQKAGGAGSNFSRPARNRSYATGNSRLQRSRDCIYQRPQLETGHSNSGCALPEPGLSTRCISNPKARGSRKKNKDSQLTSQLSKSVSTLFV